MPFVAFNDRPAYWVCLILVLKGRWNKEHCTVDFPKKGIQ